LNGVVVVCAASAAGDARAIEMLAKRMVTRFMEAQSGMIRCFDNWISSDPAHLRKDLRDPRLGFSTAFW
jgi:hypothetical protein